MPFSCLRYPLAALLCLAVALAARAEPAAPAGLKLDKVVLVMRHGIRPATDTAKLQAWSARTWPAFAVADGQLTAHGAAAINVLGHWQRRWLDAQGLFVPGQCPPPAQVFIWASPVRRTQATGQALAEAMFPGCQVLVRHAMGRADTLFHPSETGLGALDPQRTEAAILAAAGGSLAAAQQRYAADLLRLQQLVGVPAGCAVPACTLSQQPWQLKHKGGTVKLGGPLGVAAAMAETLRMQYAEGLPLAQAGFGQLRNAEDVSAMLALRSAKYSLTQHVPYIAQRGGSQLLSQVLLALQQTGLPAAGGPPPARWVAFIGHDSNIAQLRTLLGFHWQVGTYPADDAAPGGALLFRRWADPRTGARYVSVDYVAQTLEQLRQLSAAPPAQVAYTGLGERWVPLAVFVQQIAARLDPSAAAAEAY